MLKLALHPTDACCSPFGRFAGRSSRNKFSEQQETEKQQEAAATWQLMNNLPPQYQHIHLPRGEVVIYAHTRPNIRVLANDIRNLGYDVWEHAGAAPQVQQTNPPLGVVLYAIVLGGELLLFAARSEGSTTSDSSSIGASDQDSEESYEAYPDANNVKSATGK